jgi:hypothetical protein
MYLDFEFELNQKAAIVWDHGVFIDSFKSDKEYLLIYSLDKKFQYKFAVLHLTIRDQRIIKIEFLDNLHIDRYIPANILETIVY